MRLLIAMILSVVALAAVAQGLASPVAQGLASAVVRRAAATDMLYVASSVFVIPALRIPTFHGGQPQNNAQAKRHVDAFMLELKTAAAESPRLLHDYIALLHNHEVDIDHLVDELYQEMQRVADQYVARQKSTYLGAFQWFWGSHTHHSLAKLDDAGRKRVLRQALQNVADTHRRLNLRERGGVFMTDVYRSLQARMNDAESQSNEDTIAFYEAFPQLNVPLLENETALVQEMLPETKLSPDQVLNKLELEMHKSLGENDNIELHHQVHLDNILSRDALAKMIKNYYKVGKVYETIPGGPAHLLELNLANPRNSVVLQTLDVDTWWNITWAQLREEQTLLMALGRLMQAMNLDWPALGKLIYPQDEQAAARLITRIAKERMDVEPIIAALQAHRATLQDDELAAHIDTFVADLPHLAEGSYLLGSAAYLLQDGLLTQDNQPTAGLEGASPRAILKNAIDRATKDSGRWGYLNTKNILNHSAWYLPSAYLAGRLSGFGLSETQLRQQVFTASGYDKLQHGRAFSAQEIEAVRQLVSPEKVEALLHPYASNDKKNVIERVQVLPLALQLETFVQTLATQINSDGPFVQALDDLVQADGVYAPLALTLRQLHKPQRTANKKGKRKRKIKTPLREVRLELVKIAAETGAAQKKYFVAEEKLQDHQTTAQQEEMLARQEQLRAKQDAQEKARRQRAQRVSSLANKIGRQPMPLNTPIWLRLRALLAYLEIDSQALVHLAAMKTVGAERFYRLIDPDAETIPTEEELNSISEALSKHTLSREKRHMIPSKQRELLLENMVIEIEAISNLVEVIAQWGKN